MIVIAVTASTDLNKTHPVLSAINRSYPLLVALVQWPILAFLTWKRLAVRVASISFAVLSLAGFGGSLFLSIVYVQDSELYDYFGGKEVGHLCCSSFFFFFDRSELTKKNPRA